jgi:hypothetical protein
LLIGVLLAVAAMPVSSKQQKKNTQHWGSIQTLRLRH